MNEEKAHITVYVDKNPTQEDAINNPEQIMINKLAEVISYLETRIAYLEKCLTMEPKKRGIIVKYNNPKEESLK